MNITNKLLAVAILSAVSCSAFAQEKANEISFSGSVTNIDFGGVSMTMTQGNVSYGKYLTPQLVGTVSYRLTDTSTSGFSSTDSAIGLGAKYYLNVAKSGDFVPFGEAGLSFGSNKSSGSSTSNTGILIGAGASYFMTETASIDGAFDFISASASGGGASSTITMTILRVGLTQRF